MERFYQRTVADIPIPVSFYDLLLVMLDNDTRYKEKVEDMAHRPITAYTGFTYRAFTAFAFNSLLKNGDPFINRICGEAVIVHPAGHYHTGQIDIPHSYPCATNAGASHWVTTINMARRLHRMAERAAQHNERWQTLVHLEEAACHSCMALISLYTGHRQQQAILSQLLGWCDNFCAIKTRVFPCNTPEEAQLLQWLEMTVLMEERDFKQDIPAHITATLLQRVYKMLELADWLYTQKTADKPASVYPSASTGQAELRMTVPGQQ